MLDTDQSAVMGDRRPPVSRARAICQQVYRPGAQKFVVLVIVFNSAILGLETSAAIVGRIGGLLSFLDKACLFIFCVELLMKMACEKLSFFRSAWNLFDFIIVGVALIPGSGQISVLRSLRILRALRLITKLPRLKIIVESIIRALPSIGWISVLLLIIFYIFAVLVTTLFGQSFPEWFGSLPASMFSLFQILTLDSWSMGLVRPVMAAFPYSFVIFISFILLSSFIVLNVFIGVIVTSIGEVASEKIEPTLKIELRELSELKEQLARIEEKLSAKDPPDSAAKP
ncbi:MAG: ion transporter [Deltaproteobacteria bacterium]|jgi:voltage-gated sodium channel|nr:ion transporter [Deltaproteobacteria bacterium]